MEPTPDKKDSSETASVLIGLGTLLLLGGGGLFLILGVAGGNSGYGSMNGTLTAIGVVALAGAVMIVVGIAVGPRKQGK